MKLRRALHTYTAAGSDELSLKEGDIITVVGPGADPGWLVGEIAGRHGLFPESFSVPIDEAVRMVKKPTLPPGKPGMAPNKGDFSQVQIRHDDANSNGSYGTTQLNGASTKPLIMSTPEQKSVAKHASVNRVTAEPANKAPPPPPKTGGGSKFITTPQPTRLPPNLNNELQQRISAPPAPPQPPLEQSYTSEGPASPSRAPPQHPKEPSRMSSQLSASQSETSRKMSKPPPPPPSSLVEPFSHTPSRTPPPAPSQSVTISENHLDTRAKAPPPPPPPPPPIISGEKVALARNKPPPPLPGRPNGSGGPPPPPRQSSVSGGVQSRPPPPPPGQPNANGGAQSRTPPPPPGQPSSNGGAQIRPPPPPPGQPSTNGGAQGRPPPPPPTARQVVENIQSTPSTPAPKVRIEKFECAQRSMTSMEMPPKYYTPGLDQYSCSASISSMGPFTEKVETYNIKRSDRSTIEMVISQKSGQSRASGQATIKPFIPLSEDELNECSRKYGPAIVAFCKANQGARVGDGECWSLGKHAYEHAGCSLPIGKNFGQVIQLEQVRPGDVLQFESCVFEFPDGSKQYAGMPDHTAVVTNAANGLCIPVLEQNPKPVSPGVYDFSGLKSGTVIAFRPIPPS